MTNRPTDTNNVSPIIKLDKSRLDNALADAMRQQPDAEFIRHNVRELIDYALSAILDDLGEYAPQYKGAMLGCRLLAMVSISLKDDQGKKKKRKDKRK